jgi:hypothetical protein
MTRRKIAFATLFCLAGFGGIASAYVRSTIAFYQNAAPCGKVSGFVGLLQQANLVAQSANCAINPVTQMCVATNQCQVQVLVRNPNPTGPPYIFRTKIGHCQTVLPSQCACVVP